MLEIIVFMPVPVFNDNKSVKKDNVRDVYFLTRIPRDARPEWFGPVFGLTPAQFPIFTEFAISLHLLKTMAE